MTRWLAALVLAPEPPGLRPSPYRSLRRPAPCLLPSPLSSAPQQPALTSAPVLRPLSPSPSLSLSPSLASPLHRWPGLTAPTPPAPPPSVLPSPSPSSSSPALLPHLPPCHCCLPMSTSS